jgi:3'(2'), 5'-bisphosphate nucleotidase
MRPHPDALLARELADEAGRLLLQVRAGSLRGRGLKDAGDRQSHELISRRLRQQRPRDVVLSEEDVAPAERLGADRVWIVDPLDGTREFSEPPRQDWAVHVALWAGGELVAGAVAMPAAGLSYGTDAPVPLPPPSPRAGVRLAVSRTRPPGFVAALAAELGATLVPMGSAGVKCASVWRGEADAYVHAGGQYEWDSAAPVAVARACGLHASRIDGSALEYNRPDPWLPDLVVCRTELADRILSWLATNPTPTNPTPAARAPR